MAWFGGRRLAMALLAGAALAGATAALAQPRPPMTNLFDSQAMLPVTEPAQIGEWLRRLAGSYRFEGLVEVVYPDEDYPEHGCAPIPPDPAQSDNPPPVAVPYCSEVSGRGDCIGIGAGPGVQCMLNVTWQDFHEVIQPSPTIEPGAEIEPVGAFSLPGGSSNLAPAMAMFGVDPAKAGIGFLQVDAKGLAEGGTGSIAGNRATIRTSCANAATLYQAMKPPPRARLEGAPRSCERIIRVDAAPEAKIVRMLIDIEINGEVWTRFNLSLHRVPRIQASQASGR